MEKTVDGTFTDLLETTQNSNDETTAVSLLANYERELQETLTMDDNGDSYRVIFWTYYEPVVERIDDVRRTAGWPFVTPQDC